MNLNSIERIDKPIPLLNSNNDVKNKNRGWITIRIFISSTFRDFHSERNVLTRLAFPELNRRFSSRRIKLVPIDLRWGLTAESTSESGLGALQLCLEEIDATRGWFVFLSGERYGWVPEEYKVVPNTKIARFLSKQPDKLSVTHLEVLYGLLTKKPVHSFTYIRNSNFIVNLPESCKSIFQDSNSNKVQELRKRIKKDKYCQVREGYKAEIDIKSVEEFQKDNKNEIHVIGLDDEDSDSFLSLFIDDISNALLKEYPDSLDNLSQHELDIIHQNSVISRMAEGFIGRRRQLEILELFVSLNTLKSKSRIKKLASFLETKSGIKETEFHYNDPLLISSVPGGGKSALVSKFIQNSRKDNSNIRITPFFADESNVLHSIQQILLYFLTDFLLFGVNKSNHTEESIKEQWSDSSTDNIFKDLMFFLQREIKNEEKKKKKNNDKKYKKYKKNDDDEKKHIKKKQNQNVLVNKMFVFIIDDIEAVIDFDNFARTIRTHEFPPNVRFIFTGTRNSRSVRQLVELKYNVSSSISSMISEITHISLGMMNHTNIEKIAKYQLKIFGKELDSSQMKLLSNKKAAGNVMWLSIACSELRNHGVFETLTNRIEDLPINIEKLFDQVLIRLEQDFTKEFVQKVLSVFVVAYPKKISEDLLLDILDIGRMQWTQFCYAFYDFLLVGEEITIRDKQMRSAIRRRYLIECFSNCYWYKIRGYCDHISGKEVCNDPLSYKNKDYKIHRLITKGISKYLSNQKDFEYDWSFVSFFCTELIACRSWKKLDYFLAKKNVIKVFRYQMGFHSYTIEDNPNYILKNITKHCQLRKVSMPLYEALCGSKIPENEKYQKILSPLLNHGFRYPTNNTSYDTHMVKQFDFEMGLVKKRCDLKNPPSFSTEEHNSWVLDCLWNYTQKTIFTFDLFEKNIGGDIVLSFGSLYSGTLFVRVFVQSSKREWIQGLIQMKRINNEKGELYILNYKSEEIPFSIYGKILTRKNKENINVELSISTSSFPGIPNTWVIPLKLVTDKEVFQQGRKGWCLNKDLEIKQISNPDPTISFNPTDYKLNEPIIIGAKLVDREYKLDKELPFSKWRNNDLLIGQARTVSQINMTRIFRDDIDQRAKQTFYIDLYASNLSSELIKLVPADFIVKHNGHGAMKNLENEIRFVSVPVDINNNFYRDIHSQCIELEPRQAITFGIRVDIVIPLDGVNYSEDSEYLAKKYYGKGIHPFFKNIEDFTFNLVDGSSLLNFLNVRVYQKPADVSSIPEIYKRMVLSSEFDEKDIPFENVKICTADDTIAQKRYSVAAFYNPKTEKVNLRFGYTNSSKRIELDLQDIGVMAREAKASEYDIGDYFDAIDSSRNLSPSDRKNYSFIILADLSKPTTLCYGLRVSIKTLTGSVTEEFYMPSKPVGYVNRFNKRIGENSIKHSRSLVDGVPESLDEYGNEVIDIKSFIKNGNVISMQGPKLFGRKSIVNTKIQKLVHETLAVRRTSEKVSSFYRGKTAMFSAQFLFSNCSEEQINIFITGLSVLNKQGNWISSNWMQYGTHLKDFHPQGNKTETETETEIPNYSDDPIFTPLIKSFSLQPGQTNIFTFRANFILSKDYPDGLKYVLPSDLDNGSGETEFKLTFRTDMIPNNEFKFSYSPDFPEPTDLEYESNRSRVNPNESTFIYCDSVGFQSREFYLLHKDNNGIYKIKSSQKSAKLTNWDEVALLAQKEGKSLYNWHKGNLSFDYGRFVTGNCWTVVDIKEPKVVGFKFVIATESGITIAYIPQKMEKVRINTSVSDEYNFYNEKKVGLLPPPKSKLPWIKEIHPHADKSIIEKPPIAQVSYNDNNPMKKLIQVIYDPEKYPAIPRQSYQQGIVDLYVNFKNLQDKYTSIIKIFGEYKFKGKSINFDKIFVSEDLDINSNDAGRSWSMIALNPNQEKLVHLKLQFALPNGEVPHNLYSRRLPSYFDQPFDFNISFVDHLNQGIYTLKTSCFNRPPQRFYSPKGLEESFDYQMKGYKKLYFFSCDDTIYFHQYYIMIAISDDEKQLFFKTDGTNNKIDENGLEKLLNKAIARGYSCIPINGSHSSIKTSEKNGIKIINRGIWMVVRKNKPFGFKIVLNTNQGSVGATIPIPSQFLVDKR